MQSEGYLEAARREQPENGVHLRLRQCASQLHVCRPEPMCPGFWFTAKKKSKSYTQHALCDFVA